MSALRRAAGSVCLIVVACLLARSTARAAEPATNHQAFGPQTTWGSHIVWGDTCIGRVDGSAIVWGDSTIDATSVACGSVSRSRTPPLNPLAATSPQP